MFCGIRTRPGDCRGDTDCEEWHEGPIVAWPHDRFARVIDPHDSG